MRARTSSDISTFESMSRLSTDEHDRAYPRVSENKDLRIPRVLPAGNAREQNDGIDVAHPIGARRFRLGDVIRGRGAASRIVPSARGDCELPKESVTEGVSEFGWTRMR